VGESIKLADGCGLDDGARWLKPGTSHRPRVDRFVGLCADSRDGRAYPDEEIESAVDRAMWWPDYVPFGPDD
jgi:hypothetical protein